MQYPSHVRSTYVLVFGQTIQQYQNWRRMVKGGLQSEHMGWSFSSAVLFTAEEVVKWIEEREDLEIVYFSEDNTRPVFQQFQDAEVIAEALSRHQHKPWVVLDSWLEPLGVVFEAFGIHVERGMFEYVIYTRWQSQIVKEESSREV